MSFNLATKHLAKLYTYTPEYCEPGQKMIANRLQRKQGQNTSLVQQHREQALTLKQKNANRDNLNFRQIPSQ